MGDYDNPDSWKETYNESSGINKWIIIIPILVIIVTISAFLILNNSPKPIEKLDLEQQKSTIKVTNAGNMPIEKGALKVYMDDNPLQVTNNAIIQPGQSINLDLGESNIKENSVIKINFGTQTEAITLIPVITTTSITPTTTIVETSTTVVSTTTIITSTTSSTTISTTTTSTTLGITDCGTGRWDQVNWDCMITASNNCNLAKLKPMLPAQLFGGSVNTTTQIELRGLDSNNKCNFYIKNYQIDFAYTNDTVQLLLSQNMTLDQITAQESSVRQSLKTKEGTDGTCNFVIANLTAMLTRWKSLTFSTSDWDGAGCQGNYFSP